MVDDVALRALLVNPGEDGLLQSESDVSFKLIRIATRPENQTLSIGEESFSNLEDALGLHDHFSHLLSSDYTRSFAHYRERDTSNSVLLQTISSNLG